MFDSLAFLKLRLLSSSWRRSGSKDDCIGCVSYTIQGTCKFVFVLLRIEVFCGGKFDVLQLFFFFILLHNFRIVPFSVSAILLLKLYLQSIDSFPKLQYVVVVVLLEPLKKKKKEKKNLLHAH